MPNDKPLVRLYPTADAFIEGVPAVVQDVTEKRAAELLAYIPPAFTKTRPDVGSEPVHPGDTFVDTDDGMVVAGPDHEPPPADG